MDSETERPNAVDHQVAAHNPRERHRSHGNNGDERRVRAEDSLRRGHSDGDVLSRRPELFNEQHLANGETWMDFLRHSDTGRDQYERGQMATRRAAMMSAGRRRRLTDLQPDNTRRRSSSNLLFDQLAGVRRRSDMPYPATDYTAPLPTPDSTDSSFGQRIRDRPIPRRPSNSLQQSSRSRDSKPPRWQPDEEVTKCPICRTPFSFFYRKHHCRKCGRVVCANCSPHRITIPRQYIVHPPEQPPRASPGTDSGIEVVDLTEDPEEGTAMDPRPLGQRGQPQLHSHKGGIDPALGGGQEVRLCNPCVPDPNPLPHRYPSPARLSLDSFPRPDLSNNGPSSSVTPPWRSSIQHRLPPLPPEPVRAAPISRDYSLGGNPSFEASLGPAISLSP